VSSLAFSLSPFGRGRVAGFQSHIRRLILQYSEMKTSIKFDKIQFPPKMILHTLEMVFAGVAKEGMR